MAITVATTVATTGATTVATTGATTVIITGATTMGITVTTTGTTMAVITVVTTITSFMIVVLACHNHHGRKIMKIWEHALLLLKVRIFKPKKHRLTSDEILFLDLRLTKVSTLVGYIIYFYRRESASG